MTVTSGEDQPDLTGGTPAPPSAGPQPSNVRHSPSYRPRSRAQPWTGSVGLGLAVLLAAMVVIQEVRLSGVERRVDQQASGAATTQRRYERRLAELRDRTDALAERLRRTLDPAAVARHALPSVFQVSADRANGTAFAVARAENDGTYLITNQHVVQGVDTGEQVQLSRDGARHTATLRAVNARHDVALLSVRDRIPVLRLATAPPVAGEPVVVVGAPVGLDDTVTSGVVSKIRQIPGRGGQEYIQFDAAINPGNSGGPVLDAEGRVVGLATAKVVDAEGIGFAVPIGVACDSFDMIC